MKWIKRLTVLCFCLVIIIPVVGFNTQSDVVSEIDNRKLTENPFTSEVEGDLIDNIENYVSDRIGFRDEMILGYTVLNDRLFGKMVHPSYVYGKDGYVFGAGLQDITYGDYHEAFADMIKQLQDYCSDRGIPFLMVFEPTKPAVLTEYIPEGKYYNRDWVEQLMVALDERGINYLDNTETLREAYLAGEAVFNTKYDANHWNDLGAYYGVSEMVKRLQEDISTIHLTTKNELTISQKMETTLPVSQFPIEEYVPVISIDMDYDTLTNEFKNELQINPSYKGFGYYVNSKLQDEGAPRALVFQGSYMNSYGYKYLINAFGEYIHIHDYQNVLNFDYYFNIFQPECVIFEVAEYTLNDTYFSYDGMLNMQLNQPLTAMKEQTIITEDMNEDDVTICSGESLTTITWNTGRSFKYVWLCAEKEYDFRECETGYEVTLQTKDYQELKGEFEVVALDDTENRLIYIALER